MIANYTAKYSKIQSGFMGQIIEWPEVISEGRNLDDCRESLRDALEQMVLAYREVNREFPVGNSLFEQLPIEIHDVGQAA